MEFTGIRAGLMLGTWKLVAVGAALCVGMASAAAQEVVTPPVKPETGLGEAIDAPLVENPLERTPDPVDPLISGPVPGLEAPAVPYAPYATPDTGMPDLGHEAPVYLVARLSEDGPALTRGLTWRVYADKPAPDGRLDLVATAKGGDADLRLKPGDYLVHTAFGYAGRTSRIHVRGGVTSQTILLNAGGLKLDAQFSGHQPIRTGPVVFDIYESEFNSRGERKLVAGNVKPGEIVRLNADTYHVVNRYGAVNAVVRADIRVEPGKLTEATVYQNAARVTLKLVSQEGGEAIANTRWSVLTPGGDMVVEATGAFPAFVLASGEYQVIARNENKLYSREFAVATGNHGEVEVLTSQLLKQ
ncbi:hypothetical protein [Stappia sp.]|uniref:hypothetical protein n=1 Tax=Stappia sp. TaxID=1870903 RepID=UPI0025E27CD3|nr:hypothetical protein [Stappia sp.]